MLKFLTSFINISAQVEKGDPVDAAAEGEA